MSCAMSCGCTVPVGGIANIGLPKQLRDVLENMKNRGANIQAEAIFTFFWEGHSDLDIWVRHKETGEFVSFNNRSNATLGMVLDVDANANTSGLVNNPIENIGITSSARTPDGTYELYLNNYANRNSGHNFFNVLVAFKKEGENFFRNVAWFRNSKSFDAANVSGEFSQMLKVTDIVKQGRKYSLTNLTDTLEKVYTTKEFIVR